MILQSEASSTDVSQYTELEKQADNNQSISSASCQLFPFPSSHPPPCDSFLTLSDSDFSFYIGVTSKLEQFVLTNFAVFFPINILARGAVKCQHSTS